MQVSITTREALKQAYWGAVEAALAGVAEDAVTLPTLEAALESALRAVGARSLSTVVAAQGTGFVGRYRACGCGGQQETDHYGTRTVQTVLGTIAVERAAYRCAQCGQTEYPLDAQLELPADQASATVQTRLSLCCALEPFVPAVELFEELTGLRVSAKRAQLTSEALGAAVAAQHACPGTAVPSPAAPAAPVARLYLGVDGVMYCTNERTPDRTLIWREAKVGVFFTPKRPGAPGTGRRSRLVPTGPPLDVAEPESQHYVVHCGSWPEFAAKVWQAGQQLGLATAREIIVVGDGAVWITSLIAEILAALPGQVIQILDLRHAEQHLWAVAHACVPDRALAWIQTPLEHLRQGRVTDLVAALQALTPPTPEAADLVATTIAYYEERRALMDYPRFRAQGLQIGSGLAESACKRLVGQRAKGPGMHWSVAGAQAVLTLRAARLSGQWHEVLACARSRSTARAG